MLELQFKRNDEYASQPKFVDTLLAGSAGTAYYDDHLKTELEAHHSGEFVAIDPSTARYFLGRTATAALLAAHSAMPESQFFLTRVGKTTAHRLLCKSGGKPAFLTLRLSS